MSAPSLRNRLRLSIIIIILPFLLMTGIGYFFFQQSTNAFNNAIEDIISDVVPVTELKDKIQQTVIPFNLFLDNHQLDNKNRFLYLSNDIKNSLANPIKLQQKEHSLENDIYRLAYLNWRNSHRIATKIFAQIDKQDTHISHHLLREFYQYVIETTLSLDKLHLAMQDRVKIRFQKAKDLKFNAIVLSSIVFLLVYILALITIFFLNRSIIQPIEKLAQWSDTFLHKKTNTALNLKSYKEFEAIAAHYSQFSKLLEDERKAFEQFTQQDELTQMHNKRAFIEQLNYEHTRHQRYNTQYSLMLIDIDHMSSVSQNYGESVSELTLVKIANMLKKSIRPTDVPARYERDIFIILLPEVDEHGATHTAERIRNSISEYVFKINNVKFGVTVSIGLSLIHETQSLLELLQCVDMALQNAKLAGRNQVQLCDRQQLDRTTFYPKFLQESDLKLLK